MRRIRFTLLAVAALAAPVALAAQVTQQGAARLVATTASADARAAIASALDDLFNGDAPRAHAAAVQAVAADSTLGIARVVMAQTATGLAPAPRRAELDRGVADAANASAGELAYAATLRALALGAPDQPVWANAAAALLPGDASAAYLRALLAVPVAQQVDSMRAVTQRFPGFGPAFNVLAYQLWYHGDHDGGMAAVRRYVQLEPRQPNAHDSMAELLQFNGQFADALPHYQEATQLDSTFTSGYEGIAEVHFLLGHAKEARDAYAVAADHAATPAGRVNEMGGRSMMYLLDAGPKMAASELQKWTDSAETNGYKGSAAAGHRALALIGAAFGDRATVAGHLTKAEALTGSNAPNFRGAALAYALAGDTANAAASAAKFRDAVANGTAQQQLNLHDVNAAVAVARGDLATARAEVEQSGGNTLGRAMLAQALAKAGKKADAAAVATQLRAQGSVTMFDVVARAIVAKM